MLQVHGQSADLRVACCPCKPSPCCGRCCRYLLLSTPQAARDKLSVYQRTSNLDVGGGLDDDGEGEARKRQAAGNSGPAGRAHAV